jgi:hypothetical protein
MVTSTCAAGAGGAGDVAAADAIWLGTRAAYYMPVIYTFAIVAVLLVTITFVGFTSAPGGAMPQGYAIPTQKESSPVGQEFKITHQVANKEPLVFWYFNAIGFFTASCALVACWGTRLALFARFPDERSMADLLLKLPYGIARLLLFSSIFVIAAFIAAAWVVLPWPHNLGMTIIGCCCCAGLLIFGVPLLVCAICKA